jgi:hypothetical protein
VTAPLAAALDAAPERMSGTEALRLVCTATGWPVGHAWVRLEGSWRSGKEWYDGDPDRFEQLRAVTAACDFGPGRGIVAAVLHLEATRFMGDLSAIGSEARRDVAEAAGLHALVGVPVIADSAVQAVLEFLMVEAVEPVDELADLLRDLARRTRPGSPATPIENLMVTPSPPLPLGTDVGPVFTGELGS